MEPWEPWPPALARTLFLRRLTDLLKRARTRWRARRIRPGLSRLPAAARRRCSYPPTGNSLKDILVHVEAGDGSQALEGVILDGLRDEDGAFYLDAEFTVFTTDDNPGGELIRVNGALCHVEIL